jgi:hypothetical protein
VHGKPPKHQLPSEQQRAARQSCQSLAALDNIWRRRVMDDAIMANAAFVRKTS